jgi:phosphate-selective porin OprO and OprP
MIGGLAERSTYLLAGASVIGLLAAAPEARAQDMQQIQAQINEMQATIQALQKQVQDAKAQAAAANAAAANAGGSDLDLKVKWKGAPELSSVDGKYSFKVRGRLMVDYNGIDQDERITKEGDISAVELRRARLGVEGVVYYDWKYKFEIEFAGDEVEIKDAYLAYANWWGAIDTSEIRIGNQYVYTSLEQITSSRFITFLERAAFTDPGFLPSVEADRQIGAAIVVGDEHWSFQTGAYGASVGPVDGDTDFEIPGQEDFDNDKLALSVRGTVAPINREVNGVHQVVHLGASFRHRDAGTLNDCSPRGGIVDGEDDGLGNGSFCTNSDEDGLNALFQYRGRGADLHLADAFVDTPQFADEDNMWHLEAAFVWGPFSMQGEYAENEVDGARFTRTANLTDPVTPVNPTYTGWYADASWYLTGETRNYLGSEGIFGRTKVKNPVWGGSGGWGAWQIAGRYDVLDLSDKAEAMQVAYGCSECGEQQTWLFGLNWLLTDYTALKLQVSQSHITGGNNEPRGDRAGFNRNNGADITGVGVRWQVDW